MPEGYNIFSEIRLSLGAGYGISTFTIKSLPMEKSDATTILIQRKTTNDIIQNKQGAFTGSVVLGQRSDSLITDTATDCDIQVVKATANDAGTNALGITEQKTTEICLA